MAMLSRSALAGASLLAMISMAQAASVAVLKGEALFRHGDGYETLKGAANLAAGNTIVPKPGSSVKVTFSNGCSVFLGAGVVFSVPETAPCDGASTGAGNGVQEADTALTQDWSAVTQTTAFDTTQTNLVPYFLGAVAIGGIAAAVVGLSGGGDEKPTSP
jgi:hypothetical protein